MKLFEPVRIGTMELRNRIVMSPMTTGYASLEQLPTQRLVDFLVARARGGVGLLTVEACTVDPRHREVPRSMHFATDDVIEPHRRLVDAVHAEGAKIQPQIVHPGPDALSPQMEGIPSVGPSVIPSYLTGTPSRALEASELPELLAQYASAVRRVREAGYDGVELHAAHGYMLLGSFLSPWRNRREDDYAGATQDGRLRLLLEVLASIRREVGEDFPITLRVSGYERVPGGRRLDDTARMAPQLVAAGIDAFHVSGGVIDRLTSMIVTGARWGDAHNLACARAVKNVVDVPVMSVGRIHRPELAETILKRGDADLIVMGRPLLADPDLPEKVRRGDAPRAKPCISCQSCIDSMERGPMGCAVNGRTGHEGEGDLGPAPASKRVLVVGAGPGGLEAARLLALRGHRVTLVERQRFLGGAFLAACVVHPENAPLLTFWRREIARLPVEVRRGVALSAAEVRAFSPDAVVVATGGRLVVPELPGADLPFVVSGPSLRARLAEGSARPFSHLLDPRRLRALSHLWMPFGRRVVVVGADLAALELAEFLASRGRRVTVLEAGEQLAPEVGLKRLTEHMDRLDRQGVAVNTGVEIERIEPGAVVAGGRRLAADSVVLAGRLDADTAFFDAVKGEVPEAHAVGDCTGLGLVRKATEEAARVAAAV